MIACGHQGAGLTVVTPFLTLLRLDLCPAAGIGRAGEAGVTGFRRPGEGSVTIDRQLRLPDGDQW